MKTRRMPPGNLVDGAAIPDIEAPTWLTDIPGDLGSLGVDNTGVMQFGHETHGHPGILTVHGLRDLMHYVTEEIGDAEEEGEKAGKKELPEFLRRALPLEPSPVYVLADLLPARAFHTETFIIAAGGPQLTGGAELISARTDRTRAILTNTGVNPAYFSFTDDADSINTLGDMAWAQLGPSAVTGTQGASVQNEGTQTGPAALTVITSVSLPPGTWNLFWQTGLGAGAVAAAEANNFRLRQAGATLLQSVNAAVANTQVPQEQVTIIVPAGANQTIDVVNIGAGTATANYIAQISAIPVLTPVTSAVVPNQRELRSGGKIWVYSPLGTTIDMVEEYGFRNREMTDRLNA